MSSVHAPLPRGRRRAGQEHRFSMLFIGPVFLAVIAIGILADWRLRESGA
jgi:hypothetical protein